MLPSLKGLGTTSKGEKLYSLTGTTGSLMYMAPEVMHAKAQLAPAMHVGACVHAVYAFKQTCCVIHALHSTYIWLLAFNA